jgi:RNase H-like domain found in reverse transcriptase/Integrase zinc binding domain
LNQPDAQGRWHPIAFMSRKMLPAETRYQTQDSEMLAIVEACKHWRHYLEGSPHLVKVLTDHKNLCNFFTNKELNGRQARWQEKLAAYPLDFQHRPGVKNPADAPSRRPDYMRKDTLKLSVTQDGTRQEMSDAPQRDRDESVCSPTQSNSRTEILPNEAPMSVLGACENSQMRSNASLIPQDSSTNDTTCAHESGDEYHTAGDTGVLDPSVPHLAIRMSMQGETAYSNDLNASMVDMIRKVQGADPVLSRHLQKIEVEGRWMLNGTSWTKDQNGLLRMNGKVMIPDLPALKQEILRIHHDDPQGGHFGEKRTQDTIKRRFYWHKMTHDIKKHVFECQICQRNAVRRHKPYGLLRPLPAPQRPAQWMSLDFLTGIPPSRWRGKVYDAILVIVEMMTKFTIYLPCSKTIDAPELADMFYERVIPQFGMPENLVSDRGSLFTSDFWSSLYFCLTIKWRLSTIYHPQTDSQTERQNQVIEYYLYSYINWE